MLIKRTKHSQLFTKPLAHPPWDSRYDSAPTRNTTETYIDAQVKTNPLFEAGIVDLESKWNKYRIKVSSTKAAKVEEWGLTGLTLERALNQSF